MALELGVVRAILILALIFASYHLRPFHWSSSASALLGAALGILFVLCEWRLQKVTVTRLIGAAVGLTAGIFAALMVSHLLSLTSVEKHTV
ncbi:MAG TPA: PIN domain nuclease, partial [Terriglobia bacterium]|nr:PIN domain nuclease [Terriglobia bacterium]